MDGSPKIANICHQPLWRRCLVSVGKCCQVGSEEEVVEQHEVVRFMGLVSFCKLAARYAGVVNWGFNLDLQVIAPITVTIRTGVGVDDDPIFGRVARLPVLSLWY